MRLFLYSSRFLRRGCRAPGFGTPSLRLGLGLGFFLFNRVPYDSILSWFLIFLWCCVGFGLGCRGLEEQALERELRVCSEFCYEISSFQYDFVVESLNHLVWSFWNWCFFCPILISGVICLNADINGLFFLHKEGFYGKI